MLSDLEAALAAHLNGKFFWEPTNNRDSGDDSDFAIEIRKAQKVFAKGAKHVTSRSRVVEALPRPPMKKVVLDKERKEIEPIINAICYAYRVTPEELFGKSTSYRYNRAKRHMCWALYKYIPNMTSTRAGRLLGKDHATVLHGKRSFQADQDLAKVAEVDCLMGWK